MVINVFSFLALACNYQVLHVHYVYGFEYFLNFAVDGSEHCAGYRRLLVTQLIVKAVLSAHKEGSSALTVL